MTGRWLKGIAIAALALVLGCGGGRGHFTPNAVPVAIKLREPLARSNTSEIGSIIASARTMHQSGAITDNDLTLFVLIQDLATSNSWEDAKKVLEEAINPK
jgi:hypothetical protein